MMQLSRNFSLAEFRSASQRPLTADEERKAAWWAVSVLQPARDVYGPIRVTSFVRSSDRGAHASGEGLDVVPVNVSIRALADWIAARTLRDLGGNGSLAQVIDESGNTAGGPHIHLARSLVAGAVAGYRIGPINGSYPPTTLAPGAIQTRDYQALLAASGAALLLAIIFFS